MTKNRTKIICAIITSITTIIGTVLGVVSGQKIQSIKTEQSIENSGIITINNEDSTETIMNSLFDKYDENIQTIAELEIENESLVEKNSNLVEENKNLKEELTKLQENGEKSIQEIPLETITSQEEVMLFDTKPYIVEDVYYYILNNNPATAVNYYCSYDKVTEMRSNNIAYHNGISIIANSFRESAIYYNLEKKYTSLSGMMAFDDFGAERADRNYKISFYKDNIFIDSFTITKGSLPTEFNIDVTDCSILKITLCKPDEDGSQNPNINLIDFRLKK